MKTIKTIFAVIVISGGSFLYGMIDSLHIMIDTSFGTNGIVNVPSGSAGAIAMQSDGKIVVAGTSIAGTSIRVARYLPDGSLDKNTFGIPNGFVDISPFGGLVAAGDVIIDANNNIVVGTQGSGGGEIIRLTSAGVLDSTFDSDGRVTVPMAQNIEGIALQNNKLLVLARENADQLFLARYNNNGSLDATFGSMGLRDVPSLSTGALWVLPNNKILVATTSTPGNDMFRLVKYTADASPFVTVIDGPHGIDVTSIVVDGMGRMYMAGNGPGGVLDSIRIVRRLSNGELDSSFGTNGFIDFSQAGASGSPKLVLPIDGSILVTSQGIPAVNEFLLSNITSAGIVNGSIAMPDGTSKDIALDANNKIIIAGFGPDGMTFQVVRYLPFSPISPIADAINALYNHCPI